MEKIPVTINFDKIVINQIDKRAKESGSTRSHIVNMLCRGLVLSDVEYYKELSKHHYLKFQEYKFMKESALMIIDTKT